MAGCSRTAPFSRYSFLQGHFGSAEQGDHHFTVLGGLSIFNNHEISVADLLLDHRIPAHAQHVRVPLADEIFGHRNRFASGNRFNGCSRGHVAQERKLERSCARVHRYQLDGTAAIPRASDESLLLEVRQMLVHRCQRGQAEAPPDFLEAGGVAVLLDEVVQVIEDFPLTFGKRQHHVPSSPWGSHRRGFVRPAGRVSENVSLSSQGTLVQKKGEGQSGSVTSALPAGLTHQESVKAQVSRLKTDVES